MYQPKVYINNKLVPEKLVKVKSTWPEEYIDSLNKKAATTQEIQVVYTFIFDDGTEIHVTELETKNDGDGWDYYLPLGPGDPQVYDSISVPDVSELAKSLPCYKERVPVPCPCGTPGEFDDPQLVPTWQLYETIIHLNDTERWTREDIADWLETLDLDLEFK